MDDRRHRGSEQSSQQELFAANHATEVLDRLMLASGAKTDVALARLLGVSSQVISRARRDQKLPAAWPAKLALQLKVSTDWLIFGYGEKQAEQACPLDIIKVPRAKARLSAGSGSLETTDEPNGHYAFNAAWLHRKGRPDKMRVMPVTGDSMEPEIRSGDEVLIDESQREVSPGLIYTIGIDEEVVVKVVDKLAPGTLTLRSYNAKDYPPRDIDIRGDLADTVRIIGRVIWWCREAR